MPYLQVKILKEQLNSEELSEAFKRRYLDKTKTVELKDTSIPNKRLDEIEVGEAIDCNFIFYKKNITVKCSVLIVEIDDLMTVDESNVTVDPKSKRPLSTISIVGSRKKTISNESIEHLLI